MSLESAKERFLPPLWVLTVALVGLLGWLVYELKEIVVLVVVGYICAYVIDPILDRFEEKKLSRPFGVFLILVVITIFFMLMGITAVPTIVEEFDKLNANFPQYVDKSLEAFKPLVAQLAGVLPQGVSFDGNFDSLLQLGKSLNADQLKSIVGGIFTTLLKGYSITLTILNLFLLPFIIYYLAIDIDRINKAVLLLFPKSMRPKVQEIASEIDLFVSSYVRGQLTVGAILFVFYAIGLAIIGVDLWFLLAFISGFGNLIPYVGSLIGIVLSSILALVTFGDFGHLIAVWGVFAVVQFLEGTFITPKIVGDKVGLSPLVVLLALVSGGSLFGLLGIFLAVPAVAIFKVFAKYLHQWFTEKIEAEST